MSSDNEDEHEETAEVRTSGCDIYYYGDIDRKNVLNFVEKFKTLEADLLKKAIDLPGYTPTINVRICSDGGDVHAGMSAMDTLKSSKVRVHTYVEGVCCSAGTFMLLGGVRRYMGKHAYVLIHQLSSGFMGKYTELRDELRTCKKIMKTVKKLYKSETDIPKDVLKDMMTRDIYINADECIKYGVVHEIS
ncbi:MAG: Clp protease ClpP [Betaproteobacteria bacterium]|jgi:ATP-dependent Clp endopeptidase proteolytic subunit ClpP|nr:Clp protease ClpP [Betaproteobacteria bacterium]